ncbi:MAG: hypothetical protein AAGH89_19765 [Verrucomicrobiota bacterium]
MIPILGVLALLGLAFAQAQGPRPGGGGPRPTDLGAADLDLGESGIDWYTTWETAEAEAQRTNKPIMFVAAATQCNGISGVF